MGNRLLFRSGLFMAMASSVLHRIPGHLMTSELKGWYANFSLVGRRASVGAVLDGFYTTVE